MYTGQLSITSNDKTSLYQATCELEMDSAQELLQNAYSANDWSILTTQNSKSSNEMKENINQEIDPAKLTGQDEIKVENFLDKNIEGVTENTSPKKAKKSRRKTQKSVRQSRKRPDKKTQRPKDEYADVDIAALEGELLQAEENIWMKNDADPDFIASPRVSIKSNIVTRHKAKHTTPKKSTKNDVKVKGKAKGKTYQRKKKSARSPRKSTQKERSPSVKGESRGARVPSRKIFVPRGKEGHQCNLCKKLSKTSILFRNHLARKHGMVFFNFYLSRRLLHMASCASWVGDTLRKRDSREGIDQNVGGVNMSESEKMKYELLNGKGYKFASVHRRILLSYTLKKHYYYKGRLYGKILKFIKMRKDAFCNKKVKGNDGKNQDQTKQTQCDVCGVWIGVGRNYSHHLQKLHGVSKEKAKEITGYPKFRQKFIACKECSKEFRNAKHLRIHMNMEHGIEMNEDKEMKYTCPECNKIYLTLNTMRWHMKWIHGNESIDQLLQCEIKGCTFTCGNLIVMKRHVIDSHPGMILILKVC